MSETQRDETTVEAVGLPAQTWEFIRGHVKPRDRYVIETPDRLGEGFHRFMQTVAGYWLLPAVATTDAHAADVLVYLGERGPRGASCAEAPQLVCVLGHGR